VQGHTHTARAKKNQNEQTPNTFFLFICGQFFYTGFAINAGFCVIGSIGINIDFTKTHCAIGHYGHWFLFSHRDSRNCSWFGRVH